MADFKPPIKGILLAGVPTVVFDSSFQGSVRIESIILANSNEDVAVNYKYALTTDSGIVQPEDYRGYGRLRKRSSPNIICCGKILNVAEGMKVLLEVDLDGVSYNIDLK